MATNLSTVQFLAEQIQPAGLITYKKMFGEYLIYCNGKPVFLICDDTLFIKILPETEKLLRDKNTGYPYDGAKEHYVVEDADDAEYLTSLAVALEKITPLPKPRKRK